MAWRAEVKDPLGRWEQNDRRFNTRDAAIEYLLDTMMEYGLMLEGRVVECNTAKIIRLTKAA